MIGGRKHLEEFDITTLLMTFVSLSSVPSLFSDPTSVWFSFWNE
jgi:hypothetical protein